MRKKAIIHIGFDKTGTTALQKYLLAHSGAILKRTGYSYAKIGRQGHEHLGVAQSCGFGFPDNAARGEENGDHARIRRFYTKANLRDVVVSSEHFCYGADPGRFSRLRALFAGYDVTIIVYVRTLPGWLRSVYGEMVKWGFPGSFESFLDISGERMDYAAFLDQWAAVFGRGNLMVMQYEKERGALVQSFLRLFDSELAAGRAEAPQENPSITPFESEVIRAANTRLGHQNGHQAYDLYKFYAKLKQTEPGRWRPEPRQSGRHGFAPPVASEIMRLTEKFASAYVKSRDDRAALMARTLEDLALPAQTGFDAAEIASRCGCLIDAYRSRLAPSLLDRIRKTIGAAP